MINPGITPLEASIAKACIHALIVREARVARDKASKIGIFRPLKTTHDNPLLRQVPKHAHVSLDYVVPPAVQGDREFHPLLRTSVDMRVIYYSASFTVTRDDYYRNRFGVIREVAHKLTHSMYRVVEDRFVEHLLGQGLFCSRNTRKANLTLEAFDQAAMEMRSRQDGWAYGDDCGPPLGILADTLIVPPSLEPAAKTLAGQREGLTVVALDGLEARPSDWYVASCCGQHGARALIALQEEGFELLDAFSTGEIEYRHKFDWSASRFVGTSIGNREFISKIESVDDSMHKLIAKVDSQPDLFFVTPGTKFDNTRDGMIAAFAANLGLTTEEIVALLK